MDDSTIKETAPLALLITIEELDVETVTGHHAFNLSPINFL